MMARDWAFGLQNWLGRKIGQPSAWMEYHTEVPIDVHVKQRFNELFEGTGLTADYPQDVQNVARVVYPDCPALVDSVLLEIELKKERPLIESAMILISSQGRRLLMGFDTK